MEGLPYFLLHPLHNTKQTCRKSEKRNALEIFGQEKLGGAIGAFLSLPSL